MLLLQQDIIGRRQVIKLVLELEFKSGKDKKYEIKAIWDSAVYTDIYQKQLPELYYLIF